MFRSKKEKEENKAMSVEVSFESYIWTSKKITIGKLWASSIWDRYISEFEYSNSSTQHIFWG